LRLVVFVFAAAAAVFVVGVLSVGLDVALLFLVAWFLATPKTTTTKTQKIGLVASIFTPPPFLAANLEISALFFSFLARHS
jgi:hypothetical protein